MYSSTLASYTSLPVHDEIAFDLLWSFFVPGKMALYMLCPMTAELRSACLV